jgi:hypothetical protein
VGNRPLEAGGRRTEMRAASGSAAGGRAGGQGEMQARLRGEGRPGRERKCSALLCSAFRTARLAVGKPAGFGMEWERRFYTGPGARRRCVPVLLLPEFAVPVPSRWGDRGCFQSLAGHRTGVWEGLRRRGARRGTGTNEQEPGGSVRVHSMLAGSTRDPVGRKTCDWFTAYTRLCHVDGLRTLMLQYLFLYVDWRRRDER